MKLPKPSLLITLSIGAVSIGVAVLALVLLIPNQQHTKVSGAAKTYKKQLQGEVDTSTGAPRDGRDPANQQQNSLASAASKPNGSSKNSDATSTTASVQPQGLGKNGCFVDYGIQGQECLPAHAATNGVLTCDGVREHFPNGIKVTGTDRYKLDTNNNHIACDSGDKA